ncbi:hypothetical protein NQ317_009702 [Molorchus minor]|uniref:RNase H type-1 domain-containing protein n=1 Tax=Molorchus minor TaxID=1323400 RepID=A0ABQ9JEI6_9CUCU|nr:hypothetical protein NQ317_009702 [Molorchus minor]
MNEKGTQAALKALDSNKISSKLVWDCPTNLQRLATNNHVKLRWIPGHSGLEDNERADFLARLGFELGPVWPEPLVAISKATCAQSISTWSRMFMAEPTDQVTSSLLNLNRKQTRTIIGTLTGHCPLQRHLDKMRLANDPTCRRCGEDEESAPPCTLLLRGLGSLQPPTIRGT